MENAKINHQFQTDMPYASPGQGLIEYVVLLSLASLVAIVGLTMLGADVRDVFKKISFGSEPQIAEETFEITVVDNTRSGLGDLRVYAFAPDGSYLNKYQETNENGVATFTLEQGGYQFLVRYQQQGYWSEPISWPQQKQSTIQIDQRAFLVNVVDLTGLGVSDVPIYAYSGDNTYIGMEKQTNENGEAAFLLAPGEFMFRADYNGRENWSDTVLSADGSVTITVNTCPTGQFLAEYFNDRSFGGEPALVQCEGNIDYMWQTGSPAAEVNRDLFTIRWSGPFDFSEGTYKFTTIADDGVRIYIDNKRIIDGWQDQPATAYVGRQKLSAGLHEIKMEYYENYGHATAKLSWDAAITSCPQGQFLAEYFNNRDLDGEPALARCENQINYELDLDSPAEGIDPNNYSARWTGNFEFDTGIYNFVATIDDGGRVYVDGDRIINSWRNQPAHSYTGSKTLAAGVYEVKMEYYEAGGHSTAKLSWSR